MSHGHEAGYALNEDQRGGHTDPPKKDQDERPIRKVRLSRDLAAMAEIDQIMCDLEDNERTIVTAWFIWKFHGAPK